LSSSQQISPESSPKLILPFCFQHTIYDFQL
jgi:hypothetical protein